MSINHAQTAATETLSFEAALDVLFNKILEQFRQSDLFSSSKQPVIFPVYAHDNPTVGTSHAWCVIHIIKWLEGAGCRAISDRNPLLPYHAHRDDSAATRNILSNQLCLLPRSVGQRQTANERIYANKAIVFCSEVLRHYCINASAREYVETIKDLYKEYRGKPKDHLEHRLRSLVEEKAVNDSAWFHHVLTEIAFLEIRKDLDSRDHGIIPVALDGKLPDYLPFVGPTDLVLKRESVSLHASNLHKTFFKILLQIYPDQHLAIERFKNCYVTLKDYWAGSSGTVVRDNFDAAVVKCIRQAYNSILQQDQIATRHRLRDVYIDQKNYPTQESSDSDTLDSKIVCRKREFLKTLSTVPYRERKDRNPEHDEGTCIWFKRHPKFQEWKENKGPSLLWVSADPGCGKSVLAKYLVDGVLPTTDQRMTCYFFFKDDSEDQRTVESAIRCLLHQVFEHNLSLLDLGLLSRFESDSQLLHSRTDLWEIFSKVVRSKLVQGFTYILDGFDECRANDRSFFMKNLQKLFMNAATPPIKLLLTSRPYEEIARGLRKLHNKELIIHLKAESERELDKISQEIDIVIEKNVDGLGEDLELEPDVTGLIKTELTKVENRTYLWVALMMDILKNAIQTSEDAIRTLIQQLPRSVSAAYEKILRREQNEETNAKTRRLLHLIMAANKPLTAGEIAVAFSMSERTHFHEEAISRDTKFIRDFSRLLVVIRGGKIYFAHQTVKEFLIMESAKPPKTALLGPFSQWAHSFHPQHSHRVMAESCMFYLEQCGSKDYIFLDYAALNWYDHVRRSGDLDEVMFTQIRRLCDSSSKQFRTWFELYWETSHSKTRSADWTPPESPTVLIVASMVGLEKTVELLLNTKQDLDAKETSLHKTAFSWACYGLHSSVAQSLLDWVSKSNANILNKIINTVDYLGNTPLHDVLIAMRYSDSDSNKKAPMEDILRLLLDRGADANLHDAKGNTPLHLAVKCDEAVIRLLLQSGASSALKNARGLDSFQRAVQLGNLAVVRLLLDYGAESNIYSQDSLHPTPLQLAIGNCSLRMTELLLDHKADVNFECMVYNFHGRLSRIMAPLTHAMECNALDIAELLLKRGANTHLASQEWKRLLLHVVRGGNRETIKILLDRGSHLDFVAHDGTTRLSAVSECGNEEMVEILLQHGKDVIYPPPEGMASKARSETTRDVRSYEPQFGYNRYYWREELQE